MIMEISSMAWLSELKMEDPTLTQESDDMKSLTEVQEWVTAFDEEFMNCNFVSYGSLQPNYFTPTSSTSFTNMAIEAPNKGVLDEQPKQLNKSKRSHGSSPMVLSFGSSSCSPASPNVCPSEINFSNKTGHAVAGQTSNKTGSTTSTRSSFHADNVIAERRRREKLIKNFIALAAILPDLKKKDKASVLDETINYVKQLQVRVKTLEDENLKKTIEPNVFSATQLPDGNFEKLGNDPFPEVDVQVLDRNIMISIYCLKKKGVIVKALAEIEELNLLVVSCSTLPFSDHSSLHINVVAKMEDHYYMTVKELIKCLEEAITNIY